MPTAPPTDPVAVVAALYERFERRDFEGWLELLDPAVVWVEGAAPPDGGTFVGREAVRERVLRPLVEAWRGFRLDPEETEAAGPYVVVSGRLRGVYRPTGRTLRAPFFHVWRVEDGRVVHLRHATSPHLLDAVRRPAAKGPAAPAA